MKSRYVLINSLLGCLWINMLWANPLNPRVVHGDVSFANPNPEFLEITNSPNAIIHWEQFNVDINEITRFIQQNADSAVLNRINSADPSAIMGSLLSNGRVFIINPNGILFGKNARVDTAGLIASTLNLGDQNFLDGKLHFEGDADSGDIINQGLVTSGPGGEIIFIAPQIENQGVIQVEQGRLILAAGEKITLSRFDLDNIHFEVQAPNNTAINLGQLIAHGGIAGVFAGSIQHSGTLQANAIDTDIAGNIVLRAQNDINITETASITANGTNGGEINIQSVAGTTLIAGSVEAKGEHGTGGRIHVLGEQIGFIAQANINADGSTGGGTILVGGDYRGQNPEIQNAKATFIGADTQLSAEAITQGNGGKIIIWGTNTARIYGNIRANGGALSGDGGFVETSGHYLDITKTPDVSANQGSSGEWLLDPFNITITTGTGTIDGLTPNFLPTLSDSSINVSVIQSALDTDGTVTIDTNTGAGTSPGDVLFNASINKISGTGTATLNVRADGNIIVASGIQASSGRLNINFESDRDPDGGGPLNGDGAGGIDTRSVINANGGNIQMISNGTLGTGQGLLIDGGGEILSSGSATISLFSKLGPIEISGLTFARVRAAAQINVAADSFNFPVGGKIGDPGANLFVQAATSNGTISLGGGSGNLNLNTLNGFEANTLTLGSPASGSITIDNSVTINNSLITNGFTLESGNNIIFNQADGQTGLDYANGFITLNAGSQILRNNINAAFDVTGLTLNATAVTGINLKTHIDNLIYNNTGEAAVQILDFNNNPLSINSGNNNASGFSTFIEKQSTSGDLIINGVISDTTAGGLTLTSKFSGITNNNLINASGGINIRTGAFGGFTNTGSINNAGAVGKDIIIEADDIDLQTGSSINAGFLSKTHLIPLSSTSVFALGNTPSSTFLIGLTDTELNTISNNIAVGDFTRTIAITTDNPINLTDGQNLYLQSGNTIDFNASLNTSGNITLNAIGAINQTAAITANLITVASDTDITLNHVSNNVNAFTASLLPGGSAINFTDADAFEIRGINYSGAGSVSLFANGAIIQAAGAGNELLVSNLNILTASDANAGISLNNTANQISGALALHVLNSAGSMPSAGDITLINTLSSQINMLETSTNILLTSGGTITQTGALLGDALNATANTGIILNNTSNIFNTLIAQNNISGLIDIYNSGGNLNILPLGVQNLSTTPADNLLINNSGGSITVNGLMITNGGNISINANTTAGSDIMVNTDILSANNITLNSQRDLIVNGTSIGGPGTRIDNINGNIVISTGRNLILNAGANTMENATIHSAANLDLAIGNNLQINGGQGSNANARLEALNIRTLSAIGNDLILNAGNNLNTEANISASTSIALDITGNMTLNGGSGQYAEAILGDKNIGDNLSVTLNIGAALNLIGGTGANAVAAIGTDDNNINITIDAASVSLTAGNGGGTDPGAIAAIGAIGTNSNADITINSTGSIILNASTNSRALIGSDLAGGNMTLISGFNGGAGDINLNNGTLKTNGTINLITNGGGNVNGDILLNAGLLQANHLTTTATGQFTMQDGLLAITTTGTINPTFIMNAGQHAVTGNLNFQSTYTQAGGLTNIQGGTLSVTNGYTQSGGILTGNGTINSPFTLSGGETQIASTLNFLSTYTQTSGITNIQNGTLNITGDYALSGGILKGNGTLITPTLNNSGGKIAPGSDNGPQSTIPASIGVLNLNGNLISGTNSILSFDIAGSDTRGGTAGINYDLLRISGSTTLNGILNFIIDTTKYSGSVNDLLKPIQYQNANGLFTNITASPSQYRFSATPRNNGLEIITIAAPGNSNTTSRIPEDELETLLQAFEKSIDEIRNSEKEEQEEDEEHRKNMACGG